MGCSHCEHEHTVKPRNKSNEACCEHEHEIEHNDGGCCHGGGAEKRGKLPLIFFFSRLLVSLAIVIVFSIVETPILIEIFIFAIAFGLSGFEVVVGAVKSIARGRFFGENFMMAIVGIAAFSIGEFMEAVAIMLFFGVGEFLQELAVEKSRADITKLMDLRPDTANVKRDGEIVAVNPAEIAVGETFVVKPSEKIALDGVVVSGTSYLDTAAITGEPVPRSVRVGDAVLSGTINTESVIEIKVTKEYGESTASKILDLVQNARNKKSKSELFITKFARVFTPAVMLLAVCVAVFPPLLGFGTFATWIYRAVCFVAISCPCALVMSIPLGVFAGIGGAARNGILIKGGNYLESINDINTVVFDKTGTLTMGVFEVVKVIPNGVKETELLQIAATAEQHSHHPIAKSIVRAAYATGATRDGNLDNSTKTTLRLPPAEVTEKSGMGIVAKIGGKTVHIGNAKLMADIGVKNLENYPQTVVYVARDKKYIGCILIADRISETAKLGVAALSAVGVTKTVMLTGDNETAAGEIARAVGITEIRANLLPADKVTEFEKIKAETQGITAFVGDGMNDAPVLAQSDIGIAVGNIDAAIETADVVLLNNDITKIALAKKIARKTRRIIVQNITLALGVKSAVMLFAFFGFAHIWLAIFADVGVALLAILNSTRALGKRGK